VTVSGAKLGKATDPSDDLLAICAPIDHVHGNLVERAIIASSVSLELNVRLHLSPLKEGFSASNTFYVDCDPAAAGK
jgi:hypothetical protein